jgi:uncharacterized protein YyaL (SSP411 family)
MTMTNRLIRETSPYLRQHAHNPVDWYPWGTEAFERAAAEQKPVLVSIGYAACHWCHVMEKESFEDPEVAAYMNEHFINIKVDREEYPDVDHFYMDALQAMSGVGGWPLNMFVTPEKAPFYGGTYFPPRRLYGRASWMEILQAIQRLWQSQPGDVRLQSEQMLQHLRQANLPESGKGAANVQPSDVAGITDALLRQSDRDWGGFSQAPKFPATFVISFLLEFAHFRSNDEQRASDARAQALWSLDRMLAGGIYDQIGGGFARYATDRAWLIPHFEKMLYDNALLISVLSDAYRLTAAQRYKDAIHETIGFCNRELRLAGGQGFYCALDADSEGVEGKFYTFSWDEWLAILGDPHPALGYFWGISEQGNWEGVNILHQAVTEQEVCRQFDLSEEDWHTLLQDARDKLLAARQQRLRPGTDDKILLAWNALMNVALVKAAIATHTPAYLQQAQEHMHWLLNTFAGPGGQYLHVYHSGQARIAARLDGYAYLIEALLQLASATANTDLIERAKHLLLYVNKHFSQEQGHFYYFSDQEQQEVPVRKIEVYDGATPSANAVMANVLWLMGNLMEEAAWIERSEAMLASLRQQALRYPSSFALWSLLLQRQTFGRRLLLITGPDAAMQLRGWHKNYAPGFFTLASDDENSTLPLLKGKWLPGQTRVYVCEEFSCQAPVNEVAEIVAKYL